MRRGVLSYWKDPVASPDKLRAEMNGHQRTFSKEEEVEFFKLLQKQLDDGTVIEVPNWWPSHTCPVHIVPKKGGKWRLVLRRASSQCGTSVGAFPLGGS
jgi:hypothetical protein